MSWGDRLPDPPIETDVGAVSRGYISLSWLSRLSREDPPPGSTIEEAFILMFRLQRACEIQIAAQAGGSPLNIPAVDVWEQSAERTDSFLNSNESPIGKLEFDSYVRLLEEQGKSFSP